MFAIFGTIFLDTFKAVHDELRANLVALEYVLHHDLVYSVPFACNDASLQSASVLAQLGRSLAEAVHVEQPVVEVGLHLVNLVLARSDVQNDELAMSAADQVIVAPIEAKLLDEREEILLVLLVKVGVGARKLHQVVFLPYFVQEGARIASAVSYDGEVRLLLRLCPVPEELCLVREAQEAILRRLYHGLIFHVERRILLTNEPQHQIIRILLEQIMIRRQPLAAVRVVQDALDVVSRRQHHLHHVDAVIGVRRVELAVDEVEGRDREVNAVLAQELRFLHLSGDPALTPRLLFKELVLRSFIGPAVLLTSALGLLGVPFRITIFFLLSVRVLTTELAILVFTAVIEATRVLVREMIVLAVSARVAGVVAEQIARRRALGDEGAVHLLFGEDYVLRIQHVLVGDGRHAAEAILIVGH